MKKILFFSPFSEISVHAVPEAELALALKKEGNDITIARCKGLFNDVCISMSARGITADSPNVEKKKICTSCISKGNYLYKKYGLKTIFIDDFYTKKACNPISRRTKLYSLYEFFLDKKICSLSFNKKIKKQAEKYYKSAEKLCQTAPRLLNLISPYAVVTYNNYYGLNHIFSELAKKIGAKVYTIHGGASIPERYSTLFLHENYRQRFLWSRIPEWKKFRDIPLCQNHIKKVNDHIKHLFKAADPWVYSKPWEGTETNKLKNFFKINPELKTYVLLLTSTDEMFAAQECDLFSFGKRPKHDQFEWLKQTVSFVQKQKNANLIIRIHPRETPNKRESVFSQNFKRLVKYLDKLEQKYIKINWPSDNISIHDLAKITDVCLNRTSTAGLEMMLHNVPVLQFSKTLSAYPHELNIQAQSLKKYKTLLNKYAIECPPKPDLVRLYRWIYFKNHRICGNLRKSKIQYYINFLEERIFCQSLRKRLKFEIKWFFKNILSLSFFKNVNNVPEIAKTLLNSYPYYFRNDQVITNPEKEKAQIIKSLKLIQK